MIKDSGERKKFSTGMVRDVTDGKVDYTLALDGPLFERLAKHLTEGAKKYAKRNWMGARTEEEYLRFRESLLRHLVQYLRGDTDEDHFAAVAFNLNGMEYVKERLEKAAKEKPSPGKYIYNHIDGKPVEGDERRTGPVDRRMCNNLDKNELRRERIFGRRSSDTKIMDYWALSECGK